jgi:UDP-N-acetylmuramyl-tripeptide synthetase
VEQGSVFFAISGVNTDGKKFIPEALARGAIAIVCEELVSTPKNVRSIWVENTRIALARAAKAFYHAPDAQLEVFGVTGTNGKTTVSRLIKSFRDGKSDACGLIGTIDYVIGKRILPSHKTTPEVDEVFALMAEMAASNCNSVSMEVSSHGIDQDRVFGVDFDTLVFLNLTQDHLDYHGSMEAYYEAKASLFKGDRNKLPCKAVVNVDDPYGERLVKELDKRVEVVTFAAKSEADYSAKNVQYTANGTIFTLVSPYGSFTVHSPLVGSFNVSNLLAAFAATARNARELKALIRSLDSIPAIPGRLEIVDAGQDFMTVVDYAHTHDALDNLLQTVRALVPGRVHVVFGCGGDRDREKRPLMMEAACRYADSIWATSDNPRTEDQNRIFDDMLKGAKKDVTLVMEANREKAIQSAIAQAESRDAVVIAGKGHETYQILKNTIVPFDDRSVARNALEQLTAENLTTQNNSKMAYFAKSLLAKWTRGEWINPANDPRIEGFSIDSRNITSAEMFVALRTEKRDGHAYVTDAARKGATAALTEEWVGNAEIPQLKVKEGVNALQMMAKGHRLTFSGPVVGITGSNGKTSTKEMLALLLGEKRTLKTAGNLNNYLGVPLTLLRLDSSKHDSAVVEAGINQPGEMSIAWR